MNIQISPSKIKGTIVAPSSKSITHRAIIIASLARGESKLTNILLSDDTKYTIEALKILGTKIKQNGNTLIIQGSNGKLIAPKKPISVGNSGSTMRMIAAIASLAKGTTILTGEKRLCQRPMGDLLTALNAAGIHARSLARDNCPPIEIQGGLLKEKKIHVRGDVSSQYISALLLISPFGKHSITIIVDGKLRSKPYVALTIDVMKTFGVIVKNDNFKTLTIEKGQIYKSRQYKIEGDYSSASYFFAAAAISGNEITVKNLNNNSMQGDKYFLDILKHMGSKITIKNDSVTVMGSKKLLPVVVDMNDYPDIVQTLAIVAAFAKGKTIIRNIDHLRLKESDRIETTATELKKMGIDCSFDSNSLTIIGGKPKGAKIDTHNDHRVAMSFAIAALKAQGVTTIENVEVVNKSYPTFFADLKNLGAKMIS